MRKYKFVNNMVYTAMGALMVYLYTSGHTIFFNWIFLCWLLLVVSEVD